MSSNKLNEQIRRKVAEYFQNAVKDKYVMDFGGGTGTDLSWLTANKYQVCFCEPSNGMRKIAIELNANKIKSENIHFLNDFQTNFQQWSQDIFLQKFDGVLANFCVFNTIDDIPLLLKKLDSIIKPGGHIIALLLDTTFGGILKNYSKNFLISFVKNNVPHLVVQYSGNSHNVYLYTPSKIKAVMPRGLLYKKVMPMGKSGFMLIHLQKSQDVFS